MRIHDSDDVSLPPGGWGAQGAIAGLGSVATTLTSLFVTSYLRIALEDSGTLSVLAGLLHACFPAFGLFAVPLAIYATVMRRAERRIGATPEDGKRLAFVVAVIIYGVHLPLILFVWFLTGISHWPWR